MVPELVRIGVGPSDGARGAASNAASAKIGLEVGGQAGEVRQAAVVEVGDHARDRAARGQCRAHRPGFEARELQLHAPQPHQRVREHEVAKFVAHRETGDVTGREALARQPAGRPARHPFELGAADATAVVDQRRAIGFDRGVTLVR